MKTRKLLLELGCLELHQADHGGEGAVLEGGTLFESERERAGVLL